VHPLLQRLLRSAGFIDAGKTTGRFPITKGGIIFSD
jgi:hypothetical protein